MREGVREDPPLGKAESPKQEYEILTDKYFHKENDFKLKEVGFPLVDLSFPLTIIGENGDSRSNLQ